MGEASLRRVGVFGFPVWELRNEGVALARVGRLSWFRIYFRRGVQVELADGTVWRLRSHESGGQISAVLADESGQRVAVGTVGVAGYGIHGKDFNYLLFLNETEGVFSNEWSLSSSEAQLAQVRRQPAGLTALAPVPVAAAILVFVIIRLGIPGDKKIEMPSVQWTTD